MSKNKKIIIIIHFITVGILFHAVNISAVDYSYTRPLYTQEEIDGGALNQLMDEGNVTFNSIADEDAEWYDETNFVGARIDDGNHGKDNIWDHISIAAKDGETYVVRMFIHNNTISNEQTWKTDNRGVAKDTHVSFNIPQVSDDKIYVHGFIRASNAVPQEVFDSVAFESEDGQKFHLEYMYGSALLENNAIEPQYDAEGNKYTGRQLSDDIVNAKSGGILIGFDALDGKIPGCYYFSSYVTIKVKVVYDYDYSLEMSVRPAGTKGDNWAQSLDVEKGDILEYQVMYKNTSEDNQYNVTIKGLLPQNLEYELGSTRLWNAEMDGYTNDDDTVTTTGVNIGSYGPGANAYIRFRAKVTDVFDKDSPILISQAQGIVGNMVMQDSTEITLQKVGMLKDVIKISLYIFITVILFLIIILFILSYRHKN